MIEKEFSKNPVVAILRNIPSVDLTRLVRAISGGGIKFIEITMNSDNALSDINRLREEFLETVYIGAGTVLSADLANEAINAGAQFIVAPNTDEQVIDFCLSQRVMMLPGAMTPTEIHKGIRLGCSFIKVFPANCLGVEYFRQVMAPFDFARLIAFGGITTENAGSFVKNGAYGVGVGNNVCNVITNGKRDYAAIAKNAEKLVDICRK